MVESCVQDKFAQMVIEKGEEAEKFFEAASSFAEDSDLGAASIERCRGPTTAVTTIGGHLSGTHLDCAKILGSLGVAKYAALVANTSDATPYDRR